jgi:hypothetical protein
MKRFLSVSALLFTFSIALQAQGVERLVQRTRIDRANGAVPGSYTVRVLASDGKGGASGAEGEITVR